MSDLQEPGRFQRCVLQRSRARFPRFDVMCLRRLVRIATRVLVSILSEPHAGVNVSSVDLVRCASRVTAGFDKDIAVARGGAVCIHPGLARTSPDTRCSCGRTERQHQKAPRRHDFWSMRRYLKLARGGKRDVAVSRSSPKLHWISIRSDQ